MNHLNPEPGSRPLSDLTIGVGGLHASIDETCDDCPRYVLTRVPQNTDGNGRTSEHLAIFAAPTHYHKQVIEAVEHSRLAIGTTIGGGSLKIDQKRPVVFGYSHEYGADAPHIRMRLESLLASVLNLEKPPCRDLNLINLRRMHPYWLQFKEVLDDAEEYLRRSDPQGYMGLMQKLDRWMKGAELGPFV